MALPSVNLMGIVESTGNVNKFVPHYSLIPKLYSNTRFTPIEPRSVMFTKSAFDQLDFWNLDADFFFVEDMINYNELLGHSAKHFDYFSGFLKILRIAHSLFEKEDMLNGEWTKNKHHLMDIYSSMLISDVILVSPVLRRMLLNCLPKVLSEDAIKVLRRKFLVLPPPDMYKLDIMDIEHSFSKLIFLWNHRFNAVKRPKEFFGIIADFHKTYPEVPVRILVTSSLTKETINKNIPEEIQPFVKTVPFTSDVDEYKKIISKANITLGTAEAESFGISIFDSVKAGLVVLNLPQNKAFASIVEDTTTFHKKEIVDKIYKVYKDERFRNAMLKANLSGLKTLPNIKQYRVALADRLSSIFEQRLKRVPATSDKLKAVIKRIRKEKAITKKQVYETMGWKATGSIINSFWSQYYYGLRKLGVNTTRVKNTLYFHMEGESVADTEIKNDKPAKIKGGLFRS